MDTQIAQSLAQSGDGSMREIGLLRIMRTSDLGEDDKRLLRDSISTLPFHLLLELVHSQGDLGCPASIVQRVIDELPRDHAEQFFFLRWAVDPLQRGLDADGFAELVERARPYLSHVATWDLASRVRGSALFNAIADKDAAQPQWMRAIAPTPLVVSLLGVRYDERAIRARLETEIAQADRAGLMRLSAALQAAGEGELGRKAWRRSLEGYAIHVDTDEPTEEPKEEPKDGKDAYTRSRHWEMVLAWVTEPSPDKAERVAWFADRVAELERRGYLLHMFLGGHGDELRKALAADVARVLIERGEAPIWAASTLAERLSTRRHDGWGEVFLWAARHEKSWHFLGTLSARKAMIIDAPMPEDAPDDFDEAFLRFGGEVIAAEQEQLRSLCEIYGRSQSLELPSDLKKLERLLRMNPGLSHVARQYLPLLEPGKLAERLLEMPLTPSRAARIARMLVHHPKLFAHPRMSEVTAALAGPIEPEAIPPLDAIHLHVAEHVELYRKLSGAVAEERLRQHVRESFARMQDAPAEHRLHRGGIAWWWPWLPACVDADLRTEMRAWLSHRSLWELVDLHRSARWIVDDELLETAARRHLEAGHSWHRGEVPPVLRRLVEERVRRTDDDQEAVHLLGVLEKHGATLGERLALVIAWLDRCRPTDPIARTSLLATRSAWEEDGARYLRSFLRWRAWGPLNEVWMVVHGLVGARREKGGEQAEKLLAAVHLAFATVLLDLAAEAVEARDDQRLVTLLTAVLKLDPPPTVVRQLVKLRRHEGLSSRALERIEAGIGLFKSFAGRKPGLAGLYEATSTLATAAYDDTPSG